MSIHLHGCQPQPLYDILVKHIPSTQIEIISGEVVIINVKLEQLNKILLKSNYLVIESTTGCRCHQSHSFIKVKAT